MVAAWALVCSLHALDSQKAVTQYVHRSWRAEDGLPSNNVTVIIQRADGFLWLGTQNGLVRFDGARFTRPLSSQEATDNRINCLLEDRDHNLWIGTDGAGVLKLDGAELSVMKEKDGLAQNYVRAMLQTSDGAIWLGLGGGGATRLSGKLLSSYRPTDGHVYALVQTRSGSLWAGTAGGLYLFTNGSFERFLRGRLPHQHINTLMQDRRGRLWIGSRQGLSVYDGGTVRRFSSDSPLSSAAIRCLLEDRDGNLWVGTGGQGLFRIRDGHTEAAAVSRLTTTGGLSDDSILTLAEDNEGNLWIGTANGLDQLRDGKFTTFSRLEGLPDDQVLSVCETSDGSLWTCTTGGGLSRMTNGRFVQYTPRDGLDLDFPSSLWPAKDGGLWIGSSTGLARYRDGKFRSYGERSGLLPARVTALFEQDSGRLLLGQAGLTTLENNRFVQHSPGPKMNLVFVYWVSEDREGDVWLGCSAGLACWRDGAYRLYTTRDGLPDNTVHSVHQDRAGTLWTATREGLARFRDGKFTAYRTADGMHDRLIFRILEDDYGYFWINSSKGIFRVKYQELEDFAAGKRRSVTCTAYDSAEGMKSALYLAAKQPAGWKTKDGILWFPTMKGLVRVDPGKILVNRTPPKTFIESLVVDGSAVPDLRTVTIPPGKRNLEFHYSALSLSVPEKVRFQYRVDGFDQTWTDVGTRRIAYFKGIPPGTYRFELRACNNDGVWTPTPSVLAFTLSPFFYQTGWFYAVLGISVAALLFGAHRLKMRRAHSRFAAVLAERTRVAREIHDTLLQGFAGVAYQLEALAETLPDSSSGTKEKLERILARVGGSLTETRHSIWQLRSSGMEGDKHLADALNEFIRGLADSHSTSIDFRVRDRARPLPDGIEANLLQIGREAITNALRHSGATRVVVELDFDPDYVGLRVQDDGHGFRLDERPDREGHFGLIGMRERARQIGAQISVISEDEGTEVLVIAPVR